MELQEGLAASGAQEPETAPPVGGWGDDEMKRTDAGAAADFVLTPAMKRSIAVIFAMNAV